MKFKFSEGQELRIAFYSPGPETYADNSIRTTGLDSIVPTYYWALRCRQFHERKVSSVIPRPYLPTPNAVPSFSHAVGRYLGTYLSNLREGSLSLRPLSEIPGPASQTSQL